jgi:nucleoside-diphosphate-sugar epimerase
VIHVASPFTGVIQDPKKDMLDPAIEGTLNVVRATHKAGIKRIVITASFVAVFDFAFGGAV